MNSWDNLSMAQRAEVIKLAVQNGIHDLDTIRGAYNEYASGGSIHNNPGMTGMMKAKLATAAHYGNPTARRMVNYDGRDYVWSGEYEYDRGIGEPRRGNVYVGSYDNLVTPRIQDTGNGLTYIDNVWSPENDQRSYMQSLKFNNEKDARYFGEHYKEIAPMMSLYSKGGSIHIDPSKKGTFTAAAKKHGMGVQEFASRVLANKEDYSPAMVKKANFARNASKWHGYGGNLYDTKQ